MPFHTSLTRAAAVVVLTCFLAGTAAAQDLSAERRGLVGSIGVSAGNAGLACVPRCSGDRRSGPGILLRGAANLSPMLTVGLEVDLFQQSVPTTSSQGSGSGRWQFAWTTLVAQWYPKAEEDFFIKAGAGVGVARAHATFPTVGSLNMNSTSLGMVVGIGRDFRFANGFALTAYADYMAMSRGTAYIANADSGAQLSADVINLGLALTIF